MSEFEEKAFEAQLQRAMQRVDAPPELMAFLQKAAAVKREQQLPWLARQHRWAFVTPAAWRGLAGSLVAAALVLGVSVDALHVHRQHERTEATRQFELAQQIEQQALSHTREQLREAGVDLQ
jgi:hypothetical protein